MVYDCFTFYNELDLLELRLSELNKFVDYFVVVEAPYTFTGKAKPLYYKENLKRFKKYKSKIIHIIVEDILNPPSTIAQKNEDFNIHKNFAYWNREYYQRNYILKGLINASNKDIIIIGDIDEIPNINIFSKLRNIKNTIYGLQQRVSYYYFNCISSEKWIGTKILLKKNLKSPQELRENKKVSIIKNGGWHFSYLGKPQNIQNKIKSFSHQEYNFQEFNSLKNIKFNIDNNLDIFHRTTKYKLVKIDNTFPTYLQSHTSKYKKYIKKIIKIDQNTKLLQQAILKSREFIIRQDMKITQLIPKEKELIDIKNSKFYKIWQKYLHLKEAILGAS